MKPERNQRTWIIIGIIAVGLAIGLTFWGQREDASPAEMNVSATSTVVAVEAEDRRFGFHCLGRDGHHEGLKRQIRRTLNDPNVLRSYKTQMSEAIEDHEGRLHHIIRMEFGSTNEYGAMARYLARGHVYTDTCEAVLRQIH